MWIGTFFCVFKPLAIGKRSHSIQESNINSPSHVKQCIRLFLLTSYKPMAIGYPTFNANENTASFWYLGNRWLTRNPAYENMYLNYPQKNMETSFHRQWHARKGDLTTIGSPTQATLSSTLPFPFCNPPKNDADVNHHLRSRFPDADHDRNESPNQTTGAANFW